MYNCVRPLASSSDSGYISTSLCHKVWSLTAHKNVYNLLTYTKPLMKMFTMNTLYQFLFSYEQMYSNWCVSAFKKA